MLIITNIANKFRVRMVFKCLVLDVIATHGEFRLSSEEIHTQPPGFSATPLSLDNLSPPSARHSSRKM